MKIYTKDVISYEGKEYVVSTVYSYALAGGGRKFQLAKAEGKVNPASGEKTVYWVEALTDDMDDRYLFFKTVSDLSVSIPPPDSISYKGTSYVKKFDGEAQASKDGGETETIKTWRYRAGGDVFIHIDECSYGTTVLVGQSVHKSMVDISK